MIKPGIEVVWRLRELMADRGLYMTTEIVPLLKEQGIELSREQIYRIATRPPQRLSLELLGALCEILKCTPNDLIQFKKVSKRRKAAGDERNSSNLSGITPVAARIRRPVYDEED